MFAILKKILEKITAAKPTVLSVDRNLKRFLKLPYAPAIKTSIVPVADNSIYALFHECLSYGPAELYQPLTGSDLFGVMEINIADNFAVTAYPLPVGFPQEMTTSAAEFRHLTLEAVSGDDLIFLLKGPRQPETHIHHHFFYVFETDTKRWCRIVSIGEDGTYRKQPIPAAGNIGSFPPELPENSHKDTLADVMVWSPGRGKVRIETEREDYWDEKHVYTEAIRSKMFYGYFQNPHP
ncbi:MAG: hypothetical protein HC887_08690 [Desulfobacteraceae bacterium]|nr:hypothetical protein [Desulfobacteraceae bacterium]